MQLYFALGRRAGFSFNSKIIGIIALTRIILISCIELNDPQTM